MFIWEWSFKQLKYSSWWDILILFYSRHRWLRYIEWLANRSPLPFSPRFNEHPAVRKIYSFVCGSIEEFFATWFGSSTHHWMRSLEFILHPRWCPRPVPPARAHRNPLVAQWTQPDGLASSMDNFHSVHDCINLVFIHKSSIKTNAVSPMWIFHLGDRQQNWRLLDTTTALVQQQQRLRVHNRRSLIHLLRWFCLGDFDDSDPRDELHLSASSGRCCYSVDVLSPAAPPRHVLFHNDIILRYLLLNLSVNNPLRRSDSFNRKLHSSVLSSASIEHSHPLDSIMNEEKF